MDAIENKSIFIEWNSWIQYVQTIYATSQGKTESEEQISLLLLSGR